MQKEIKIYKGQRARSINKQHMSKYVVYLQNVNIVALVNSNKTTFFPNNSKQYFILFPRQIHIQTSSNVKKFS